MAQSDNWIDATGNWDDAPKWSAGVPDQDSDVTIGDTTNGNVTLNHAATIHSLTINASNVLALVGTASLTVAGDFANTGDFGNSGTLDLDTNSLDGGGSLTIGGTLDNTKTVQVGSSFGNMGADTTLTLGGLVNESGASFKLFGSTSHAVTLAFSGGTGFTGNDGTVELSNVAPLTLNNAFTNSGVFQLDGNTPLTITGDVGNSGTLNLDTISFDGGGSLTIGGTLDNTKMVQVGSSFGNMGADTTLTANGLNNTGTISLFGSASHQATLAVNGPATDSGTINIEAFSNLTVTGGMFSNGGGNILVTGSGSTVLLVNSSVTGGTLTLGSGGTLVAASGTSDSLQDVNVMNNGTLEAMGKLVVSSGISGSGQLQIDANATLELGNGTSETTIFTGANAELRLDLPATSTFTGLITNFAVSDILELGNRVATSATPSLNGPNTTLTVNLDDGSTLTYTLAGDLTADTFSVSLVNGGVDSDIMISGTGITATGSTQISTLPDTVSTGVTTALAGGNPAPATDTAFGFGDISVSVPARSATASTAGLMPASQSSGSDPLLVPPGSMAPLIGPTAPHATLFA